jgi:hypothetical protein
MQNNNKNKCETCPICLDTIRNINSKRVIKQECCNKPFHKKCINKWYKVKKICPLCRTEKKQSPLFNTEEIQFLSNSFLSIAPALRPLYEKYLGDDTMNGITDFISNCETTLDTIITDTEINSQDTGLNELSDTLITAKNLVRSIRTIMNNNTHEII